MNPSVSQSMSRSTNRSDRPIRVSVCGFIMNNPARRPTGRPGRVVAAGGPTGRRCSDGTCVCGPKEWHTGRLSSLDIQVGTGRIHSSIDPSIHRSIDRSIDRNIPPLIHPWTHPPTHRLFNSHSTHCSAAEDTGRRGGRGGQPDGRAAAGRRASGAAGGGRRVAKWRSGRC